MRKIAAILTAFVVSVSMSMTAFAVSNETIGEGSSPSKDVKVIVDKDSVGAVYSVDIAWDSLEFTYNLGTGDWNPTNHSVTADGATGWDKESANIKVTNHSNVGVSINASFVDVDVQTTATLNGVTATLENNSFNLEAGKLNEYATADNDTAVVEISGTPSTETAFTVGKITVTVSANP